MRIETRKRSTEDDGFTLTHHDLILIPESEDESRLIDLLGQPESFVQGQIRLADGYGDHYILLQPRLTVHTPSGYREFAESPGISQLLDRLTETPESPRPATPGRRKTKKFT